MLNEENPAKLSVRYMRFAEEEAVGHSPLYAAFARGVANDRDAMRFLTTLPDEKRQPNLLFAAVRHLLGTPPDWPHFRRTLLANSDVVRSIMLSRSTQTNEPARCATLLPVLAQLPQPLALIEVGASAGLCLLSDFYGYDYKQQLIFPRAARPGYPVFACMVSNGTPLPEATPGVIWRGGLDLDPIDAADPSQAAWLEALVWPGQGLRLANLRAALRIAAEQKPRIVKGNLLGDDLARLCGEAPKEATLVIFHTAVLAYVETEADRRNFAERVMSLCRFWICNESPRIFPEMARSAGTSATPGQFLLSVNGSPVAWTDPHGAAINWIGNEKWV